MPSVLPLLLLQPLAAASLDSPMIEVPPENGQQSSTAATRSLLSLRGHRKSSEATGGNEASNDPDDRYPYFARLKGSGLCEAVLISKRFVLTAAHCVSAYNEIEIGITKTNSSRASEDFSYNQRIIHPDYDADINSNNIALYELDKDVPDEFRYVRLEENPVTEPETALTAIAMGDTQSSNLASLENEHPLEKTFGYVTSEDCQTDLGEQRTITPDMLCAFDKKTKASCQGESGGPLVKKGANPGEDALVGLVSWGSLCAGDHPSIYTRVSYFYDWILDNMCHMNPDGVPSYVNCSDRTKLVGNNDALTRANWGSDDWGSDDWGSDDWGSDDWGSDDWAGSWDDDWIDDQTRDDDFWATQSPSGYLTSFFSSTSGPSNWETQSPSGSTTWDLSRTSTMDPSSWNSETLPPTSSTSGSTSDVSSIDSTSSTSGSTSDVSTANPTSSTSGSTSDVSTANPTSSTSGSTSDVPSIDSTSSTSGSTSDASTANPTSSTSDSTSSDASTDSSSSSSSSSTEGLDSGRKSSIVFGTESQKSGDDLPQGFFDWFHNLFH